jgi:hypothetical protein
MNDRACSIDIAPEPVSPLTQTKALRFGYAKSTLPKDRFVMSPSDLPNK